MWRCTDMSTGAPRSTASGRMRATSSHRTVVPPGLGLRLVVEEVAQTLAAAVQAHLRRRHRDAELLGDLLVRQPVDVLQHHEYPQLRRQVLERAGEAGEGRRLLGRLLGLGLDARLDRLLDHGVEGVAT